MTVAEVKELYKGEYVDLEVYKPVWNLAMVILKEITRRIWKLVYMS